MSDEPQDPKFIEPPGEPTPDAENFSSSAQPPREEDLPEQPSQTGESPRAQARLPQKPPSGGLLRRLTGSLRRLTGPLGNTGWLGASRLPNEKDADAESSSAVPPADPAPTEPAERSDQEREIEPVDFLSEIPWQPPDELPPLRRVTGPLDIFDEPGDTGALIEPDQPRSNGMDWMGELRQEPVENPGEWGIEPPTQKDSEDLRSAIEGPGVQRRLTGPLDETGVPGETGELHEPQQPPSSVDWMGEVRREASGTAEVFPGQEPDEARENDWELTPPKTLDTAELQRRLTGPLADQESMVETGRLEDTGALPEIPQPPEQPVRMNWGDEAEAPEKPQADSGRDVELPSVEIKPADRPSVRQMPQPEEDHSARAQSENISAQDWTSEIREETNQISAPGFVEPPVQVQPEAQEAAPPVVEVPPTPDEIVPAASPAAPEPMSPLRRVTGSLRRIITGALGKQSQGEQEISDDMMAGRLEHTLTSETKADFRREKDAPTPEKPSTGSLVRRVTGSLRRVTGSVRAPMSPIQPTKPPDQPRVIPALWQQTQEPPKQPPQAGMDWMSELRKEPEGLIEESKPEAPAAPDQPGTIGTEAAPAVGEEPRKDEDFSGLLEPMKEPTEQQAYVPPPPMSPLRRVTGSLRRIITGALGLQQKSDEQEISDDMVAGRLEHTLTTPQRRDMRPMTPVPEPDEVERETTGSLIHRLTGSLRRITGSLRTQPSQKESDAQQPHVQWQLPESPKAPPASPVEETPEAHAGPVFYAKDDSVATGWQTGTPVEGQDEDALTADEPISLIESGAIAALEETKKPAIEPDWMKSIRGETAQAGQDTGLEEVNEEPTGFDRVSGSLRRLISDMMGSAEQVEEQGVEEELPGSYRPAVEEESVKAEPTTVSFGDEEEEAVDDSMAFLDGLEARFGQFEDVEIPEEKIETLTSEPEEGNPFDFLDKEEMNIWGQPEQPAAPEIEETPGEAFWNVNAPDQPKLTPDLSKRLWGEQIEEEAVQKPPEPPQPRSPEDLMAAQYLAGEVIEEPEDEEKVRRDYLRDALENTEDEEPAMSVQDIRAIALEDYEETEPDWEKQARAEAAPVLVEEAPVDGGVLPAAEVEDDFLSEPAWNFNTWIASHSRSEKILLVEAAVVIVALLVSIPFFIITITRGTSAQQAGAFSPRPLSRDLPYPVSLMLPGGWDFALEKSTISGGQWKPASSEWLEGTELRRVVALPWNPQTEAVIRTFQPGDLVELGLSNDRTIRYKVDRVERVPVNDASIMSDLKPSLVIILYEDKSNSRWVVICKP